MLASVPLVPTFVNARAARRYKRRNRDTRPPERTEASEFYRGRFLQILRDGECLHRLVAPVERRCPQDAGIRLELGVVGTHPLDVVAPRDRDAVLGAFQLRLQREEILVRLEVGIAFDRDQEPPERAGKRALRILELLELRG